jgi:LPPG:FO 2-phospho-L-lactate transferase
MLPNGVKASALGVAECYRDFLGTLLIAEEDRRLVPAIQQFKINPVIADIRMTDLNHKRRLAREVLALARK